MHPMTIRCGMLPGLGPSLGEIFMAAYRLVFAALGRVVTLAIALLAGRPHVDSQVDGGP